MAKSFTLVFTMGSGSECPDAEAFAKLVFDAIFERSEVALAALEEEVMNVNTAEQLSYYMDICVNGKEQELLQFIEKKGA